MRLYPSLSPLHRRLFSRLIPSSFISLLLCSGSLQAAQVVISEIQFNPRLGQPEFVEFKNVTGTPLDMALWELSDGVDYVFPDFNAGNPQAGYLKPFETILVTDVTEATFRTAYAVPANVRVFGPYTGKLNNAGERITLSDKNGVTLASVQYDDEGQWPVIPDGTGHTLTIKNPNRKDDDYRNWTSSGNMGGTPGTANISFEDLSEPVHINEAQLNPAGTAVAWVEVHNSATSSVDLDGVFLSANPDFSDKIPLTGSVSGNSQTSLASSFPVLGNELTLYLVSASGTVLDAARFRVNTGKRNFQAFPDGGEEFFAGSISTQDAANAPIRNTDIVINEIMPDPPSDSRNGEFIELYNRGTSMVSLAGWEFASGVQFTFPSGVSIAPGDYLVVAANKSWIESVYSGITVVGDYGGNLKNEGELLRLVDASGSLVDQVHYAYQGDWPEMTKGAGSSLELVNPEVDNDLPTAWKDSDETSKSTFESYSFTSTYKDISSERIGGSTAYKELHFHLVGDAHIGVKDIQLKKNGVGTNLVPNADQMTTNTNGSTGWLAQGTHWASDFVGNEFHLKATGHGDNRANKAEIDVPNMNGGDSLTLTFDARWMSGKPRLICQTFDHSFCFPLRLPIPNNLGTPGAQNSSYEAQAPPSLGGLLHSPPVPKSTDNVRITAKISFADC
ncbi:MAG: hypothetical protein ACJA16_001630 [Akkermansiaceae bacterium]|jgi:hypothetical protein